MQTTEIFGVDQNGKLKTNKQKVATSPANPPFFSVTYQTGKEHFMNMT